MNLLYKYLFTAELFHHYYSDGKCFDFTLVPAGDGRQWMRDARLIHRFSGNKLYVGIEVDPLDEAKERPAVALPSEMVLRFYLQVKNPLFHNFTNLPSSFNRQSVLYFSNVSGTKAAGHLFLTAPINSFDQAAAYFPGDLVKSGSSVFENLAPSVGKAVSNDQFWKNTGSDSVATGQDVFMLTGNSFSLPVSPASGKITTEVFGFNPATKKFDRPVLDPVTTETTDPQAAITVNLFSCRESTTRYLQPGRYSVKVNGAATEIYFDPEAKARGVFGVIEIVHHPALAEDFGLLRDGKVKEVDYRICFHNRSTIWKYVLKQASTNKIASKNNSISFVKSKEGVMFHSRLPLALSQAPVDAAQVLSEADQVLVSSAKNAGIESVKKITINQTEFFCSEIFLNY
jgi:hypothetical protein